jgi:competence ComEA-like helix-hairpin-helix protein
MIDLTMTLKMILLGAVVAFLSLANAASAQEPLRDGPGKETLERVCSACHELDTATGTRHTRAEWRAIVDAMVNQGARATDEEFAAIIEYLAAYVAMVNVNKATTGEIETILEIPSKEAEEIVRYRAAKGEFKDMDSLKNVPGVDAKVLEERKDRIAFR